MRKILLMVLSLVGLFDSIYLLWEYTSPAHPMVCVGGGCDAVRASAYSHLGGLPVPIYGVFMYAFLVLLLFLYPLLPSTYVRLTQHVVMVVAGAGFLFRFTSPALKLSCCIRGACGACSLLCW